MTNRILISTLCFSQMLIQQNQTLMSNNRYWIKIFKLIITISTLIWWMEVVTSHQCKIVWITSNKILAQCGISSRISSWINNNHQYLWGLDKCQILEMQCLTLEIPSLILEIQCLDFNMIRWVLINKTSLDSDNKTIW